MFAHSVWGLDAVQPRPRGARAHALAGTGTGTASDASGAGAGGGAGAPKRDLFVDRETRDNRLVRS